METHSGWFKSEDGGHTWESFGNPLSSSGRLRDIKFINRETGWIAGATLRAPSEKELGPGGVPNIPRYLYDDVTRKVFVPTVYRTDDGGKTWRAQTPAEWPWFDRAHQLYRLELWHCPGEPRGNAHT